MSIKRFLESILLKDEEENIYYGDVVDIKKRYFISEKEAYDGVPTVYYDIYLHNTYTKIGSIDLRLKMNEEMYYYGHIGYNISKKYRGHNYSYYACLLVFNIARNEYNMDELIITCNPDNIASYTILNKLNGELIEVCTIPKGHELYRLGDRMKCVFRYKIKI